MAELHIPGLGESITEAVIAKWLKADGDFVGVDDVVADLETDKATVELTAGFKGQLKILKAQGSTVAVGEVVAEIDTQAAPKAAPAAPVAPVAAPKPAPAARPVEAPNAAPNAGPLSPAVQRLVQETHVDATRIVPTGPGGRLTKGDVLSHLAQSAGGGPAQPSDAAALSASRSARSMDSVALTTPGTTSVVKSAPRPIVESPAAASGGTEDEVRQPMSRLRETIAKRLVEAQHTAAILTTFNEVDMSAVMSLRERYKEKFEKTHGVSLGFMGFFAKAVGAAIKAVPAVNAQIQGKDLVYKKNLHLSVAVSTERGLIVPVVRSAQNLSIAQIELEIKRLATKAREGKISLEDLSGGTFTITNGGVFGSLLSTPILNPPQSGILGLHKIEKRPVVVDDQIVIRPMMYVALSYDHRIIDGQQAVTFLVKVKEALEDPARLVLEV